MKKTTKALLVLTAAVALAVGTVSTVAAADDVVIASWAGNDTDGWTAKDANGNSITRGWAKSNAGIWYYFESGQMLSNSFITYRGNVYYLGGDGAMCTNWVEFKGTQSVKFNKAEYEDVADAFNVTEIGTTNAVPFSDDNEKAYKTLWCYFNSDGTLVNDAWVVDSYLWYYMDGPFCLMNEWNVNIKTDNGSNKYADFGFGKNGNMHVGWIPVYDENDTTTGQGPYQTGSKDSYVKNWIFYDNSGIQAEQGWKKINGEWYYFKDDTTYGISLLTNVLFTENTASGYTFYFNEDGVMQTGSVTLGSATKETTIEALKLVGSDIVDDDDRDIELAKKSYVTLLFKENGIQQTGIQGNYFYTTEKNEPALYEVIRANIDSEHKTVLATSKAVSAVRGARMSGNFFYVSSKDEIYFFENGYLVKNDTVSFGKVTLAFDKNGVLIRKEGNDYATVGGVKYYFKEENGSITFDNLEVSVGVDLVIYGASTSK